MCSPVIILSQHVAPSLSTQCDKNGAKLLKPSYERRNWSMKMLTEASAPRRQCRTPGRSVDLLATKVIVANELLPNITEGICCTLPMITGCTNFWISVLVESASHHWCDKGHVECQISSFKSLCTSILL